MSLPVLNSHFLVLHPPTMELLQNPGPWSADFFPIYQWDGILFIGVSHPDKIPAGFTVPEKCVIVQSEAEALQSTWKQLQLSSHNELLSIAAQNPAPAAAIAIAEQPVVELAEAQTVIRPSHVPPPHPILQPTTPVATAPPPHPVMTSKGTEPQAPTTVIEAPAIQARVEVKTEPSFEPKVEVKSEVKTEPKVETKVEEKSEPHSVSQITPQINLSNSASEELVLLDLNEKELEVAASGEVSESAENNQMPEGFMIGSDEGAVSPAQILQPAEQTPEEVASADISSSLSLAPVKTLMAKGPEEENTSFAQIAMSATATSTFDESAPVQDLDPSEELPESISKLIEIEENTKAPLSAPASATVNTTTATAQEPAKPKAAAVPAAAASPKPAAIESQPTVMAAVKPTANDAPEPEEHTVMMTSQALRETSGDHWVNDYLSKLNAHFKKSMLMILNGEKLHAWRWNEGYTPASQKTPTYNINTKSPFYLVAKTLKSYHGKVPMVGEMIEFNKFWNKDAEMGLFTVAPLIINGKLIGALITEGENDSIDLDKLDFTEKIAAEISQNLLNNPTLLKAA